jgi:GNAT superfamily N-acetyltransferase
MEVREADLSDWSKLEFFYKRIYRPNHPLQSRDFWEWQYGDPTYGRAFICVVNEEVVGHVGASFAGGIAWMINAYLYESYRGKGILGKFYELARNYYPLAATSANAAGLGLYHNMRWIRYYDLVRYVKINPKFKELKMREICSPISVDIRSFINRDTHYFRQPGLTAIKIDGFTALSQPSVGGLRVVDLTDAKEVENIAWELGYNWIDYITSWNDLKIKDVNANKWSIDSKSIIPWRLDPIQEGYFCDVTFLSEKPLPNDFVVHRSYSDHGRVGSIKL